ncbi:PAS domain S-box protein [bacterium]|nr:PAS domain S-box protein [bacterium]
MTVTATTIPALDPSGERDEQGRKQMKQSLRLQDLIPKEKLDEILQAVNEACGIGSVIADTEGRPISSESNFSRFCMNYCRATEEGRLKCYASDAYGGAMALNCKEPYVYDCHNSGLVDCATPIIVEGQHLGNLNGGQVLEEPIPDDIAIARARAIGIEDIDGYLQALKKIPRIKRARLRKIVNLMSVVTQTISDLGIQKMLLAKQSKEYLNKLINSVSDCIISLDANGTIVMSNEVCFEVFGCPREKFYGRPLMDFLLNGEDIQCCKMKLESGAADNCRAEFTALRNDRTTFPVQLSISRVNDEEGAATGYVVVLRDITEEKQVEKMKEDLVGMLTHDMRNPILAINKTLELLSSGRLGPINDNQKKIMKLAINTNDQLGSMVNAFLDIFRDDNGRFELHRNYYDMNEMLSSCIEDVALFLEDKKLEVTFETQDPVIELNCDLFRIKRTFGNLLSNAINYSVTEGKIRIATRVSGGHEPEFISNVPAKFRDQLSAEQTYFLAVIADTGYGIPEEHQESVFEKFFTVKTEEGLGRRGIGLGLAFCKLVVEAHDGIIFCRTPAGSVVGERTPGVEFHVILPYQGGAAQ